MTDRRLADARALGRRLRELRTPAPLGLLPGVLDRIGEAGDCYALVDGPIGPLFVAFDSRPAVTLVARAGDPGQFEEEFHSTFGRAVRRVPEPTPAIARLIEARVWGRGRPPTSAGVDLAWLPDFERQVLEKTAEIPRGEIRPYSWVAAEIGRPLAVRAVGNALARNPIPFVIPCHRVVRADGTIGHYGAGGPESKRAILAAEGLDPAELVRLPAAGIRYLGSDTTRIYCYPSCRNARRIADAHRVAFRTVEQAHRAGFRACRHCRPVASPSRAA
ncbi:MAG TPA: methylated-DNA--[protein]-cysteine S-methyltransferase [Candidatus Limnocylindrales bacterium]|nr:methylated-DNA--[protein]-cysteine S-methyltransferase [Candidatus Limnocylindrales bacterium]